MRIARSVDRGILGHPRDELEDPSLTAEDLAPQLLGVLGEDVVVQRTLENPVVPIQPASVSGVWESEVSIVASSTGSKYRGSSGS